ncbi:MAG TPA: AI-2E family transporter [Gaiellaceae bacterium]|nr:AI-2E family transporter [Gaiellaceae bacterium]
MTLERVVELRPRTILRVLAIAIGVAVTLEVVWIARHVIAWMVIALFLALALDPFVRWIERRGRIGRGPAIAIAYLVVLVVIAAVGATFIPKLVDEVNGFVQALPNYVHDLTHGRGRLGFLERRYHVVEKVRQQVTTGGATKVLGLSGAALSVTKSVITIIAATVTIVFLTFFMLLEGQSWVDRVFSLLPERSQARWRRVGGDVYKTVGGYVTGNILISLIAGASITVVLLVMGVPYAVALGLLVAFLDLIPLAGATVAGVIVTVVAFLHSVPAGIVAVLFFVVYQQLENHFLQPVIYGRTVQLSPLVVLVSVLVGAELAGIIGALAAIPVAGTLQVIVRDQLAHRRGSRLEPEPPPAAPG